MTDKTVSQLGLDAFKGLLGEFRSGNIATGLSEKSALQEHLAALSESWDRKFPGFPNRSYPNASLKGILRRGLRDEYLKSIIVRTLAGRQQTFADTAVVNPACVITRHARDLASRLTGFRVIATDIDPWPGRLYKCLPWIKRPHNYRFVRENIFEPELQLTPAAVVFFGACGSVSDGAMDFAINSGARYLICRTCCHENIGGNTMTVKRPTPLNRTFRIKNFFFSIIIKKMKGFYFSQNYSIKNYPRSEAAGRLASSDEFLQICRNSVDSDICRTIIDLDRYLLLAEKGYEVCYRGEMFFAEKKSQAV